MLDELLINIHMFQGLVPQDKAQNMVLDPLSFFKDGLNLKEFPFPQGHNQTIIAYAQRLQFCIENKMPLEHDFLQFMEFLSDSLIEKSINFATGYLADFMTVCCDGTNKKILDESLNSPLLALSFYQKVFHIICDEQYENLSCALLLCGLIHKYVKVVHQTSPKLVEHFIKIFDKNQNISEFTFEQYDLDFYDYITLLVRGEITYYVRLKDRCRKPYKLNIFSHTCHKSNDYDVLLGIIIDSIRHLPYAMKMDFKHIVAQVCNIVSYKMDEYHTLLEYEIDGLPIHKMEELEIAMKLAACAKKHATTEMANAIYACYKDVLEALANSESELVKNKYYKIIEPFALGKFTIKPKPKSKAKTTSSKKRTTK